MADYLMERGVEEDQLLLEEQSHNTDQNLRYSRELLEAEGCDLSQGVVVVSNGFHLTRARMLAERAGYDSVSTLAAPSSHLPSRLHMYVQEPLAPGQVIFPGPVRGRGEEAAVDQITIPEYAGGGVCDTEGTSLYEAIYVPPGDAPPPRSVADRPGAAGLFQGFGSGPLDRALAAVDGKPGGGQCMVPAYG